LEGNNENKGDSLQCRIVSSLGMSVLKRSVQ